jgi:maleylacetoacetate isomerase
VRLALELKQIDYTYEPIHLLKGEQSSKEYSKLNPLKQVPCLVDQDLCLTQSMAICLYIDKLSKINPLLPDDFIASSQIIEFCEIINCTQPLQNLSVLQYLESELSVSEDQKKKWLNRWLPQSLAAMENWLNKHSGTYCYQDKPTLADCFFLPQIFTSKRFEIDLSPFPIIQKLDAHLNLLNWVQKAHPSNQIDAPKN